MRNTLNKIEKLIFADVAINGVASQQSFRLYIENHISFIRFNEIVRKAKEIYKKGSLLELENKSDNV